MTSFPLSSAANGTVLHAALFWMSAVPLWLDPSTVLPGAKHTGTQTP